MKPFALYAAAFELAYEYRTQRKEILEITAFVLREAIVTLSRIGIILKGGWGGGGQPMSMWTASMTESKYPIPGGLPKGLKPATYRKQYCGQECYNRRTPTDLLTCEKQAQGTRMRDG